MSGVFRILKSVLNPFVALIEMLNLPEYVKLKKPETTF